jgi:pyruvate/2-oxoglutarate dehydrogenase complex dihydrolipoamide dehydrogenase (E3) component
MARGLRPKDPRTEYACFPVVRRVAVIGEDAVAYEAVSSLVTLGFEVDLIMRGNQIESSDGLSLERFERNQLVSRVLSL